LREDCYILSYYLAHSPSIEIAISRYEAKQRPRALSFLQSEIEITGFICNANEQQYNKFIQERKAKSSEIFNQPFIDPLKTSSHSTYL
jgi:isopenicillin N synthase-like dioxygenase